MFLIEIKWTLQKGFRFVLNFYYLRKRMNELIEIKDKC